MIKPGDNVIVKLEWAKQLYNIPFSTMPVAIIMPRGFQPPTSELHSEHDNYLRYISPGGRIYLPGTILCKVVDETLPVKQPRIPPPPHALNKSGIDEFGDSVTIGSRIRHAYCVHIPSLSNEESADGHAKHNLQLSMVKYEHCPARLQCNIHEHYCSECVKPTNVGFSVSRAPQATKTDMFEMGYICTIRAVDE